MLTRREHEVRQESSRVLERDLRQRLDLGRSVWPLPPRRRSCPKTEKMPELSLWRWTIWTRYRRPSGASLGAATYGVLLAAWWRASTLAPAITIREGCDYDRTLHELREIADVSSLGAVVDQLNCAALLSFEVLAKRLQAIIDAYAQDARTPKSTIARHFRGAYGAGPPSGRQCTGESEKKARRPQSHRSPGTCWRCRRWECRQEPESNPPAVGTGGRR